MELIFSTFLIAILQISGILLTSMSGGGLAIKCFLMRYKRAFDIIIGLVVTLWAGNRGISQIVASGWAVIISTVVLELFRCFLWQKWEQRYLEEGSGKKSFSNTFFKSFVRPIDEKDLPYIGGTFFGIRIRGRKAVRAAQQKDIEDMYSE